MSATTKRDPSSIGVLLADDHAIVRDGLRALVDGHAGLTVVGEADSGLEAWRLACKVKPDVVVIDLSMPGLSGIEATEKIAHDCPDVKVLALTMHEERGYVSRVLRAGAAGYALKRSASSELVRAIRAVAAGERYVDPSLAGALLTAYAARPARNRNVDQADLVANVTVREGEVLRLLALGYSNKEIASSLSISVKTVETHRSSGMARLGLTSRAALVRFAVTEGWLKDV